MKVFILTLLILNSLCFAAFGDKDEKDGFIDIDSDEGEQLEDERQPDDFVEDEEQNFTDELEDDDDAQEDEVNDEQQDSNDFNEDSIEDAVKTQKKKKTRPQRPQQKVDPLIEPTGRPLKTNEDSGSAAEENADLKEALVDKLGLK